MSGVQLGLASRDGSSARTLQSSVCEGVVEESDDRAERCNISNESSTAKNKGLTGWNMTIHNIVGNWHVKSIHSEIHVFDFLGISGYSRVSLLPKLTYLL